MNRAARRTIRRGASQPPFVVPDVAKDVAGVLDNVRRRTRSAETTILPVIRVPDNIEFLAPGAIIPVVGRVIDGYYEGHDKLKDLSIKTLEHLSKVDGYAPELDWVNRYTHIDEIKSAFWICAPGSSTIEGKEVFVREYGTFDGLDQICKFPLMPYADHPEIGLFWRTLANTLLQYAYWNSASDNQSIDIVDTFEELSQKHDKAYVMRFMQDNYEILSTHDIELRVELKRAAALPIAGDPFELAKPFGDRVVQLVKDIHLNIEAGSGSMLGRFGENEEETIYGALLWVAYGESSGEMSFADSETVDQMQDHLNNYTWVTGVRSLVVNDFGVTHLDSETVEPHRTQLNSAIKKLVRWAEKKMWPPEPGSP